MRMRINIGIYSIMALVCLMSVSAIGISPAKYSTFFEPNEGYIYSFWIVNKDHQNVTINISVKGELSPHITLHNTSISLADNETFKRAYFTIQYPESLGNPGLHTSEITFTELSNISDDLRERDKIKITPSIKALFEVIVPYRGKYLDSGLNIESSNSRHPVSFIFPLSNKGEEDIDSIIADVDIYMPDGNTESLKTNEISLGTKKTGQLKVDIDNLSKGPYKAKTTLYYDENNISHEKDFDYGEWLIRVKDVRAGEFKLGDFAEFNLTLFNDWNIEAESVVAEIIITDWEGYRYDTISSIKTISANNQSEFEAYWDTSDALPGDYFFTIRILYSNLTMQYTERITVEENRIITKYHTPPKPLVQKILPKKVMSYIKIILIPLSILILASILSYTLIHGLPLINRLIKEKTGQLLRSLMNACSKAIQYTSVMQILEERKRAKRLKDLQNQKKKYRVSIENVKYDLKALQKAVDGLNSEHKKEIINENEYNIRMKIILDDKNMEYWKDYYTSLIIDLENKTKKINEQIWKIG